MNAALEFLFGRNPDIDAAAFVKSDGSVECSKLPAGTDESRIGAMSAAIIDLCDQVSAGLERGGPTEVAIEGTNGYVAIVSARVGLHLVCTAPACVDVRRVLREMQLAITDLIITGDAQVSPDQQG